MKMRAENAPTVPARRQQAGGLHKLGAIKILEIELAAIEQEHHAEPGLFGYPKSGFSK
jgi:hypothetical protein